MDPTLAADILDLLQRYLATPSDTATPLENNAGGFLRACLGGEPYWQAHPDHLGAWPAPGDALGRAVHWALVRGAGPATVVLIHHSDTVGTEDYRQLAGVARDPAALAAALATGQAAIGPEARADLDSGAFLFGHGAADMKAGGAIQLALLKRFSRGPAPRGNLLVLALPDEENLSLGMRQAPLLLADLRRRFGLDYRLMLNSEPQQRRDPAVGMLSVGSVGKMLPFIYARGALAHAGQVFGGLNPIHLLCEAVRRVELDPDLCDRGAGEVALPPTCLFLKDSKARYDVSLPRSAFACFNVLALGRSPAALLAHLERTCAEAAGAALAAVARSLARYRELCGEPARPRPWTVPVVRFEELPAAVPGGPEAALDRARRDVASGRRTMPEATWDAVEALLDRAGRQGPLMVLGFVPPYYPAVTNAAYGDPGHRGVALAGHLVRFAAEALGQRYAVEPFYTGISDLSYSSIQDGPELEETLVPNMPLHGPAYTIPFPAIRANAMPCINVGPWGKDFHQLTERVLRDDLLEAVPRLVQEAIRYMLAP
jgi:arginine utilization protein RocB